MQNLKKASTFFLLRLCFPFSISQSAIFNPLCLPQGRSCYTVDHFEIAYLEKSLPDTSALTQPDTPLYFCMSYKGMSEMHVVLSEPKMLCQDYHFLVQCRSTLVPRNNSVFVQYNIRNKTEKNFYNERKEMKRMAGSTVDYNCTRRERKSTFGECWIYKCHVANNSLSTIAARQW